MSQEKQVQYKITHLVEGKKRIDTCTAVNDAFYTIISGPDRDSLIHTFSILEIKEIKG